MPHTARRTAVVVGAAGVVLALAGPAWASLPSPPRITATEVTFAIPAAGPATWRLHLWDDGTLEGSAQASSGTLTVAVPATTDCRFQADVSVVAPDGQSYFYSGTRAMVPGCGPPASIAGDIDLCAASGTPTTTEVAGGTLGVTGPKTVAPGPNPLAPTHVPAGTYTMAAGAPAGYVLVACGGAATVVPGGATASEPVVVPGGGSGEGLFYVVTARKTSASGPQTNPQTSPGKPGPAGTLTRARRPAVTQVGGPHLAFTGLDTGPLLVAGLTLIALGVLATTTSRRRRRTDRGHESA